eukprot:gene832-905_t
MKKAIPKQCVICHKDNSAYKCPKCRAFYCSKDCCSQHKEVCTDQPSTSFISTTLTGGLEDHPSSSKLPALSKRTSSTTKEEYIEPLTEEQKQRLRSSSQLINLLKSKRLRDHITMIDSHPSKQQTIRKMRENNRDFEEVMNLILDVVQPITSTS